MADTVKINKTFVNNLLKDPEGVLRTLSIENIILLIQKANHTYYNNAKPLLPDQIFDVVKEYLQGICPEHPVLRSVGAVVTDGKKIKLPFSMGSLDKIKNDEKALANWSNNYTGDCLVSDKLDGNSGLLVYRDGEFKLFTRGDGLVGQDITHLLSFIDTKFDNDAFAVANACVAVRGEFIISKANFLKVADKGANARNMVAGLLNAKIPDLTIAALTSFVAYELVEPHDMVPVEQMKYIQKVLKLPCVYNRLLRQKEVNVSALSDELVRRRSASPYEIDGIVVCHNAVHKRVNAGNPDYAFAFKSILTMEKAEVTVMKVEWNMSKDGIYVPVVIFTPVALDGVIISRAHGFNGKFIKDNTIGPGATIVIMRSGAVIPYILETLVSASKPQMPDAPFVWTKSGVDIKASGEDDATNKELKLRNLEYFFDKIDVRGLSGGILTRIFAAGFDTVGKVLNITKEQLLTVEGFKSTLAEKIRKALDERKDIHPYIIMDASNVLGRGIGYKKIKLICDAYPTIVTEKYIPSIVELVSLKGIEKTTAQLFCDNLPKLFQFADANGMKLEMPRVNVTTGVGVDVVAASTSPSAASRVKDKHVVFSGVRDKDLEAFIESNGGSVGSSVSKKTSLVLVKALEDADGASSKVKKAKELGVPIMLLADFKKGIAL